MCYVCVSGSSITTFASSFGMFMLGRTFVGLGCGCGVMLTPVYLGTALTLIYIWINHIIFIDNLYIHPLCPADQSTVC
jgi:predicted MFS family arabinose efflux permease